MDSNSRARVGYLGPQGTFTEQALLASAAPESVEPVPVASIYDAVMTLRRGEVEWAVAPIENSLEGSVSVTLDLLALGARDVEIVGEALLRVRHSLIAAQPVELADIQEVLTHPQVPGQCQRFLRSELAHARILPASSTAEAVRTVARERRPELAALGTVLAAEIYGAAVLREGVEDRGDNETRFVWLARAGERSHPPLRGAPADRLDARASQPARTDDDGRAWKTSIVFWGAGADSPGWLLRCLQEFASREVNLTKIESRPLRERLGSYMFFADLSGGLAEASVSEALAALRARCEVHVLGSYPEAASVSA